MKLKSHIPLATYKTSPLCKITNGWGAGFCQWRTGVLPVPSGLPIDIPEAGVISGEGYSVLPYRQHDPTRPLSPGMGYGCGFLHLGEFTAHRLEYQIHREGEWAALRISDSSEGGS